MTNVKLTDLQRDLLVLAVRGGADVNGAKCAEDVINDNMTIFDIRDLQEAYEVSNEDFPTFARKMGAVMASLRTKNLLVCEGAPMQGRKYHWAWNVTTEGVKAVAEDIWGRQEEPAAEEPVAEEPVAPTAEELGAELAAEVNEAGEAEAKRLERNRKARERRAEKARRK